MIESAYTHTSTTHSGIISMQRSCDLSSNNRKVKSSRDTHFFCPTRNGKTWHDENVTLSGMFFINSNCLLLQVTTMRVAPREAGVMSLQSRVYSSSIGITNAITSNSVHWSLFRNRKTTLRGATSCEYNIIYHIPIPEMQLLRTKS